MTCSCSPKKINRDIEEKINKHPCYSEGAHQHYARIHLPVASACNIQCNYCNRKYDCSNESRPGVTSDKLKPIEAVKKVLFVGGKIPQLSVVGIAGPGDALANPKQTFETFRLLKEKSPDLKFCLSTNGLKLPQYIDEIVKYNIDHVTVTVNTVDESGYIGSKIYSWVHWEHKKRRGIEGAKILLEQQLKGIKMLTDRGVLVKVNSVLIPGINDKDLPNVAKKLKELNVFLHNIMPLLSKPEYGTKFGLDGIKSATNKEIMVARESCGIDVKLMKHCRQCRADAVGLLGQDNAKEFTKDRYINMSFDELEKIYNRQNREKKHKLIEEWRRHLAKANQRVKLENAKREDLSSTGETKLVAVTTRGEGLINMHFGNAKEFFIYEAGDKAIKFLMCRKVKNAYCDGMQKCDNNPIEEIQNTLKDCDILLTQKIGECPMRELKDIDIICDEEFAAEPIESSVAKAIYKHFTFEIKEAI